jgi:chemotaxis protein methyltransferase CheR
MTALAQSELARLRAIVSRRTGLMPDSRFDAAIEDTLRRAGLASAADLARLLTAPGGRYAWSVLLPRLTVSETHFWRDTAQFAAFDDFVLPDLIRRRGADRRLRVWSAGCATGEEPYSLAMMLLRHPQLVGWEIDVFGTDIDREALVRARVGLYGPWSFREVPPAVMGNFFGAAPGGRQQVIEDVRRRVRFGELNLAERGWPAGSVGDCDLVLCRNVLMYMEPATVAEIADRLFHALRPGGWLAVGHSEPSADTFARFTARRFPGAVLYQRPA